MANRPSKHEIVADDHTVWINGTGGLLGRFSRFGVDVHVNSACEGGLCIPGPCTRKHWKQFKRLMLQVHGVSVSDKYRPHYLKR